MDKYINKIKSFKYMAMDKNGDVFLYVDKPYILEDNDFWSTDSDIDGLLKIATETDEQVVAKWRDSLVEME